MAETDDRLSELRQRWEADPSSRVFLQLAEEYRRHGQIDEAVKVLEKGLEYSPNHLSAQVALGRCRIELGEFESASRLLEQVIEKDPTQLVANKLLVEAYLGKRDLSRAEERLDLYTLLNDGDPAIELLRQRLEEEKAAGSDQEEDSPFLLPVEPLEAPELGPATPASESTDGMATELPRGTIGTLDEPFPEITGEPDLRRYLHHLGDEGLFPVESGSEAPSSEAEPVVGASSDWGSVEPVETAPHPLPDPEEQLFAIEEPVPGLSRAGDGDVFDLGLEVEPTQVEVATEALPPSEDQPTSEDRESESLPLKTSEAEVVGEFEPIVAPEAPSDPEELPLSTEAGAIEPVGDTPTEDLGEESGADFLLQEPEPADEGVDAPELLGEATAGELIEVEETPVPEDESEASDLADSESSVRDEGTGGPGQPATMTLGKLYLDQGHTTEAKEIFEAVLLREPGNEGARAALASLAPVPPVWGLTARELLETPGGRAATGLSEKKAELLKSYLRRIRRQA